ncbi:SDR family oxidoreductase [Flammeovirga aprica]|uniref:SDR family oxidoreductase n=1 Tax=Flammeovirga aprica JL-4 TaxID=694437 RepID=A0A7X9P0W6_9BACT|nr:SDR family oxidoreductase [Flammeovirga aprica]NME67526.1 SDR family oxidoreductase [Flammeovirga aprica JL-4]
MEQKDNQIAIVTGVSRLQGIGKAICTILAQNGIDIFFTYWLEYDEAMPWGVQENEPDLIQKEIQSYGVRCEKLTLNLKEEGAIDLLFYQVNAKMGAPTILINNATYSTSININSITSQELEAHYLVNMKAVILLTSRFFKNFNENEQGGRIINLSSGQNLSVMNEEVAYAVTKGAIDTFTRTIAQEIACKRITINAVNPGLTDTGWLDDAQKEIFLKRCPMGRIGKPEDVAKLISFLVSDEGQWITGQILNSEGGFIRELYE